MVKKSTVLNPCYMYLDVEFIAGSMLMKATGGYDTTTVGVMATALILDPHINLRCQHVISWCISRELHDL